MHEDSFCFGVVLFQFVCSLTTQELGEVRKGRSVNSKSRLEFVDELTITIPNARGKNFERFALAIVARLNPSLPAKYHKLLQQLLKYRFKDRPHPKELKRVLENDEPSTLDEEEEKMPRTEEGEPERRFEPTVEPTLTIGCHTTSYARKIFSPKDLLEAINAARSSPHVLIPLIKSDLSHMDRSGVIFKP